MAPLQKAFDELDVRVVWGETVALNRASQRVMENVGMSVTQNLATPEDMLKVEGRTSAATGMGSPRSSGSGGGSPTRSEH